MNWTKGYKAFNRVQGNDKAGTCLDFLYEEGKVYEIKGKLKLCRNGFHACKDLALTFEYYGYDLNKYVFAEVDLLGEVIYEEPTKHIAATSKIKINKFLSGTEIQAMLDGNNNSGDNNSGDCNSGHYNSGNYNSEDYNSGDGNSGNQNSGHWNSGNRNSGNRNSGYSNSGHGNSGNRNSGNQNSGHCNSGHYNSGNQNSGHNNSGYSNSGNRNTGDRNTGYWNTGDRNTGNRNTGNRNTGNWNSGDNNSGFFNTTPPSTIRVFNKECDAEEWDNAKKPSFIYFELNTELGYKKSFQKAYEKATSEDKELLMKLPNFDPDVFYELSGIRVRMEDE